VSVSVSVRAVSVRAVSVSRCQCQSVSVSVDVSQCQYQRLERCLSRVAADRSLPSPSSLLGKEKRTGVYEFPFHAQTLAENATSLIVITIQTVQRTVRARLLQCFIFHLRLHTRSNISRPCLLGAYSPKSQIWNQQLTFFDYPYLWTKSLMSPSILWVG